MYIPPNSMYPTLPRPVTFSRRRPEISLMKSSQWYHSAGLDAQAYPSPPMTDSPTSPKRTQFPEERTTAAPAHEASASFIGSSSTESAQPGMASQVLPPPAGMAHQYLFGAHPPGPYFDPRLDLQPRPRAQSIPQYHPGYQSTAPPSSILGPPPNVPYGTAMYGGPMSMSGPAATRFPKASRRAKAHVARACQNCKKAHLSCDEGRPCARCVASGKQASCVDVEHKKRGRPRLRDDRAESRPTSGPLTMPGPASSSLMSAAQAESYRVLRSQTTRRGTMSDGSERHEYGVGTRSPRGHHIAAGPAVPYHPQGPELAWRHEPLVAFLNLDLRILKVTDHLRSLLADRGDIRGRLLEEFLDTRHIGVIHRLQTQLRDERTLREPTFLPPIGNFPGEQEQQAVQQLDENNVDAITQGYTDRSDNWTFRLANGRSETFYCRVRLARTSIFFATLTLQRIAAPPSAHSQSSGYPRRQSIEMAGPAQTHPAGPTPRDMSYAPTGPSSPFAQSAPSSPFSTLPQHLITSLPPATGGSIMSTHGPGSSLLQEPGGGGGGGGGGYFPRQPPSASGRGGASSMQPPPQPSFARPNTAREHRRPEPLSGLQLPPIVSSSAPTTPLGSQFFEHGPSSQPGSARRGSGDRPEETESEEANRKRRRLNIGEIIERRES